MFRVNRIGTPTILSGNFLASSATGWMNADAITTGLWGGSVINAAPVGDFAYNFLHWANGVGEPIPASSRFIIGQQFNIEQPINGDVAGVELNGTLELPALASTGIQIIAPIFYRAVAAAGAVLGAVESLSSPVYLDMQPAGFTLGGYGERTYKTQVIANTNESLPVEGTYVHGFQVANLTAAPVNLTWFNAGYSVRQLNDQQQIGYRDTLR